MITSLNERVHLTLAGAVRVAVRDQLGLRNEQRWGLMFTDFTNKTEKESPKMLLIAFVLISKNVHVK